MAILRRHSPVPVLLAMCAVMVGACTGTADRAPVTGEDALATGGTVTVALGSAPAKLNPHTADGSSVVGAQITANVLPSVFRTEPDLTPMLNRELMAAARVTRTTPQTIVYRIRPEAAWSDGTPITADDFRYLWQHLRGEDASLDVASTTGYDRIASVAGSDGGKTVTVVYDRPFNAWQSLFDRLLPAHAMRDRSLSWNSGLADGIPVSGGPFELEDFRAGESLTLVRNEDYYGEPARLDRIVIRFIEDPQTQVAAMRNGEVDLIAPVPDADIVAQVRGARGVEHGLGLSASYEHLDFNTRHSALADSRVRRAIALGIDREALLDATVRRFAPDVPLLDNHIWLTTQRQYAANGSSYAGFDPQEATRLLSDAGYSPGADGVLVKDGRPLSLRLVMPPGSALREDEAEIIQDQLRDIGVEVRIEPAPDFGSRVFGDHDYDLALFAWTGTPHAVTAAESLFTSGGTQNAGAYRNPEVDRLLTGAVDQVDQGAAVRMTHRADRILWEDMATLPLFQRPALLAYTDRLVGVVDSAAAEGALGSAAAWRLRAG